MAPGYFVLGRTAIDNDWKTWPAILPSLSNTARCTIVFFSKDRISSTVWRPCIWPSRRSSYATNDVEQTGIGLTEECRTARRFGGRVGSWIVVRGDADQGDMAAFIDEPPS